MELSEAAIRTPIRQPGGFGRRRELPTITIERNGRRRQFRVSTFGLTMIAGFALLLSVSYISAAAYLAFRDDLIGFFDSSNARLIRNYESRIADLRGSLDRVTSRQMVEQKQLEDKIEELLRRQSIVESQGTKLDALIEKSREIGLVPDSGDSADAGGDPVIPYAAAIRGGSDALAITPDTAPTIAAVAALPDLAARADAIAVLDSLDRRIAATDEDQDAAIDAIREKADKELETVHDIVRRLDLADGDLQTDSVGGPFIPEENATTFENQALALENDLQRIGDMDDTLRRVPLADPIPGRQVTSGFGRRIDPFLKRVAMHSGIDFGADSGSPVRSTAPGTVVEAGFNGGYGNTVLVRHEGGFETRYAHLSRITVQVDEIVELGTIVGKVGSTGRSTGPHLHYEVHRDEIPQDPAKYLKAGKELARIVGPNS
jgi:murein DD-endopeptidase MepM/ murein hydrolase activator NlpD